MRSKTLLVIGAGAAVLALAACGPDNVAGQASPSSGSNGGGSQQAQGTGGKISTVADLGSLVQHNADAKNSVHTSMDMNISGMGEITATGVMKFGSPTAMDETMNMPGMGGMEMVLVDGSFYMKLPSSLSGTMGGGKPWVKIDLNGNDAISQSLGSSADMAQQADPTQMIDKIKDAGTITGTSQDTVDGQPATHYSITVDVQKMAATSGASDESVKALQQMGISSMPFDIWVNSDNLPVKIVTKMAFSNPANGQAAQMTMTVNYTDWGAPVNISAPPADQVGSMGGN
jgi:hypothetical protein